MFQQHQNMPRTILDSLNAGCERSPEQRVYTVLNDDGGEAQSCDFAGLHARVESVASHFAERGLQGKTVMLLVRDSLTFIQVFLGALWAGVIPVPAAAPRRGQAGDVLAAIGCDAGISAAVVDRLNESRIRQQIGNLVGEEQWLTAEDLLMNGKGMSLSDISPRDTAFLQYTSGSTGKPKGVVVTHSNLLSNQKALQLALGTNSNSVYASWLPLYHDMGLIGHALPAVYVGAPCILIQPTSFLQQPIRWLRAISRYGATHSGGPNFAYELCLEKTGVDTCEDLDLSSWRCAFNGGEPVRSDTVERFCGAFRRYGFKRSAMYPCYGLAESTLVVTGSAAGMDPRQLTVSKRDLEAGRAQMSQFPEELPDPITLVSSGAPVGNATVVIVQPEDRVLVEDENIGEVWTSSESVCAGYYRREQESRSQFRALLKGTSSPRYLRTGDLGFMKDGHLYVTGRLKDLIIIRGQNYYPHDLEAAASKSSPLLARGLAAAVSVQSPDSSQALCVVCELTRQGWLHGNPEQLRADVREAIARDHGLRVHRVVLIRPGSLPRTTSGKIRRSACRDALAQGLFESLELTSTGRAQIRETAAAGIAAMRGEV
jgi:acyl-CoA synthetase (AMP-forming)/AMP-acid ligase II